MRIEVFQVNHHILDKLRRYADVRVHLGVQRVAPKLSWIGVWLMHEDDRAADGRVICQIVALARGGGMITVKHTDTYGFVAVDCAVVRLQQALVRQLGESGQLPPRRGHTDGLLETRTRSRLAVVIGPESVSPRLSLIPWLRTRYRIDQVQNIKLPDEEWAALVTGGCESPQLGRFRGRMALAQLGRPDALVVAGSTTWPGLHERLQTRREVQRVVHHLRASGLQCRVIGLWADEQWTADYCLVESEQLPSLRPRPRVVQDDSCPEPAAEVAG